MRKSYANRFQPTATTYEAVQDEAFAFYRGQGDKTDGQCSRAAASAAKSWLRKREVTPGTPEHAAAGAR